MCLQGIFCSQTCCYLNGQRCFLLRPGHRYFGLLPEGFTNCTINIEHNLWHRWLDALSRSLCIFAKCQKRKKQKKGKKKGRGNQEAKWPSKNCEMRKETAISCVCLGKRAASLCPPLSPAPTHITLLISPFTLCFSIFPPIFSFSAFLLWL